MFLGQYWEWADVLMIRGQWMHDMQQKHHAPEYKQKNNKKDCMCMK